MPLRKPAVIDAQNEFLPGVQRIIEGVVTAALATIVIAVVPPPLAAIGCPRFWRTTGVGRRSVAIRRGGDDAAEVHF